MKRIRSITLGIVVLLGLSTFVSADVPNALRATVMRFIEQSAASVPIPPSGSQRVFIDTADHVMKRKDSTNTVTSIESGGGGGGVANPMTSDLDTGGFQINNPSGDLLFGVSGTTSRFKMTDLGGAYALYFGPSELIWGAIGDLHLRANNSTNGELVLSGTDGIGINETGSLTPNTWRVGYDGIPQWTKSANVQTTVGSAGGASALPATPAKYLKVKDDSGTVYVIPVYAP